MLRKMSKWQRIINDITKKYHDQFENRSIANHNKRNEPFCIFFAVVVDDIHVVLFSLVLFYVFLIFLHQIVVSSSWIEFSVLC